MIQQAHSIVFLGVVCFLTSDRVVVWPESNHRIFIETLLYVRPCVGLWKCQSDIRCNLPPRNLKFSQGRNLICIRNNKIQVQCQTLILNTGCLVTVDLLPGWTPQRCCMQTPWFCCLVGRVAGSQGSCDPEGCGGQRWWWRCVGKTPGKPHSLCLQTQSGDWGNDKEAVRTWTRSLISY